MALRQAAEPAQRGRTACWRCRLKRRQPRHSRFNGGQPQGRDRPGASISALCSLLDAGCHGSRPRTQTHTLPVGYDYQNASQRARNLEQWRGADRSRSGTPAPGRGTSTRLHSSGHAAQCFRRRQAAAAGAGDGSGKNDRRRSTPGRGRSGRSDRDAAYLLAYP